MMRRFALLLACLILLIGAAAYGIFAFKDYVTASGPNRTETEVVLPRGAGLGDIVHRLDQAGVIDRPWLFQLAVRLSGHERALKAGEYAFPAEVSPSEIIAMLTEGRSLARRFTVIEGQTVAEVFRLLDRAEGLTGELPPLPEEGSLLPETYLYSYGDSRAALVERMQKAMAEVLDKAWRSRAPDLPFASAREVLIMASIVDKETGMAHERRTVAAVFVNRLRKGMRLQSDPTIIYGLTAGQGPLDRDLTRQDWKLDHPYNTYRIKGLPPGPIGNPGRESIEAVARPADVDFLYFVADGTGGHAFARTLAEHNENVTRWQRVKAGEAPRPVLPSPPRPPISTLRVKPALGPARSSADAVVREDRTRPAASSAGSKTQ